MSEFWQLILTAGLGGVLLGTMWGRWVTNSYWIAKGPDSVGASALAGIRAPLEYTADLTISRLRSRRPNHLPPDAPPNGDRT